MKIIFAGTPEFAARSLAALLDKHEVVAVFTQPDRKSGRGKKLTAPPVKELALEHGIAVYQPSSLKDQTQLIEQLNPDVMVVVAYGMLLPQAILDIPAFGCINIHASLLPRWRGAAPIQRAIEAGDEETGVSIMKMELGLDTGPVYQMLRTPISNQDTSASLHDSLAALGAKGIINTLEQLQASPMLEPDQQDDSLANYAKKITKEEADINWQDSAADIQARIRAFNPWPICQTHHQSTRIRCSQASLVDDYVIKPNHQAGQIISVDNDGIIVACGDGLLRLEVLQRDGSRAIPSREFCNGYPVQVGELFSSPSSPSQNSTLTDKTS